MTTAIPFIVLENFHHFSPADKQQMIEDIELAKFMQRSELDTDWSDPEDPPRHWTTSSPVYNDTTGNFELLYNLFFNKCKEIFGDFKEHKRNLRECYGITRNRNFWCFDPHTHDEVDINAVYYLNIPKSDNELWGSLWLTEDVDNPSPWDYVIPKEGMLVLMPHYVYHDPFYVPTKEKRVAVNMELKVKGSIDTDLYHQYNTRFV